MSGRQEELVVGAARVANTAHQLRNQASAVGLVLEAVRQQVIKGVPIDLTMVEAGINQLSGLQVLIQQWEQENQPTKSTRNESPVQELKDE